MSSFEELPLTHLERMDEMRFQAEEKEKIARIQADRDKYVARQNAKKNRKEIWITTAIAVPVACVVGLIVYAAGIKDDPPRTPDDYKTTEAYREEQCVSAGGGWVPEDMLYRSDHGLCVFPGKSVEAPAE